MSSFEFMDCHERHRTLRNYIQQIQRNMRKDPFLNYVNYEEDRLTLNSLGSQKVALRESIYSIPKGRRVLRRAIRLVNQTNQ